MQHPALAHLPTAFFAIVPELAALDFPAEERATCSDCAVGAAVGEQTDVRPFDRDLRCCTYHPNHMNWMVGRGLLRGGVSEARIRKRLEDPEGITAVGIAPQPSWIAGYRKKATRVFGRDPAFRCPYLLPEQQGCAVWRDRGAVCRTWHCRYTDSPRGQELWHYTKRVMHSVERRLAAWCVFDGDAPDEADWSNPDRMAEWFIWCGRAVEGLPPEAAIKMRDKLLRKRVTNMKDAMAAHMPPVPTYVGPRIGEVTRHEEDNSVTLKGTSALDYERHPFTIFQLLSRLDGKTPWQEAVDAANEVVDGAPFDADLIETLFRKGMLSERDPLAPDPPPGASSGTQIQLPYDHEDRL